MGNLDSSNQDGKRTGRPKSGRSAANIDLLRQLVEDDRRKTIRELVVQSGLSQGTVHHIICNDLKLSCICAKFVPRLLTDEQKDHCATLAALNLSSLDDGGRFFMERIVSGDETWLYCFDPQSKQRSLQWHPKGAERPLKALRLCSSSKKVMLTLFFDCEGPILMHFLPKGETITSEVYCDILAELREAIRLKHPSMWRHDQHGMRTFLLHHNNATPHTANRTIAAIGSNDIDMIPHPAYSPDMVPCDFSVFPVLKEELRGHAFTNVEELKAETRRVLLGWPKDFYRRSIWDMAKRWAKCVAAGGEYFEGRGIEIPPLPDFLDYSQEEWSEAEDPPESQEESD